MKTAFAALLAAVAVAVASPFASDSLPQQDAGLRTAPGEPAQQPPQEQPGQLTLSVDGTPLTVRWEDNASVDALRELAEEQEFPVETSNYGGFEQVGDLPQDIVSDDRATSAQPGDIVLYQGRSVVLFYGSNTWSYTPLGRIEGLSGERLEELLSGQSALLSFSLCPQQAS